MDRTSLEKIRPSATGRPDASASLSAARNEHESFQIVVTGPAAGVRADASDLTGPGTLAGIHLYREALVELANASALDGGTGRYPDALVPDVDELVGERRNAFPFDVPSGESRGIWVDVPVAAGAAPGDYRGSVSMSWSGGSAVVPVALGQVAEVAGLEGEELQGGPPLALRQARGEPCSLPFVVSLSNHERCPPIRTLVTTTIQEADAQGVPRPSTSWCRSSTTWTIGPASRGGAETSAPPTAPSWPARRAASSEPTRAA